MKKSFKIDEFLLKYPHIEKTIEENNIDVEVLKDIYNDFVNYKISYENQADPTNEKVIAEIQVRTIFEEGYGEIDHKLRYSHIEIPEILKSNLLLFNRIVGSADEMASLINDLNKEWFNKEEELLRIIKKQEEEIKKLRN